MLQLRLNWDLDNTVPTVYKRFDMNPIGARRLNDVGNIRTLYLEGAFTPLAYNDINLIQKTYGIQDDDMFETCQTDLLETFNNLAQDDLCIIKMYTTNNNLDNYFNSLDRDLFINVSEPIQTLYNKAMAQTSLRECLLNDAFTKVKISKTKHMIVLISNYQDVNQATDIFLTLGLIPVIFTDYKDRFDENEIEYFKTLVNRSQVKRISNVKATETFNAVVNSTKYTDKLIEMRTQTAIKNVVQSRITRARNTIDQAERDANSYLRSYNDTLNRFYEAQRTLANLEANSESVTEEVKLALKLEGIENVRLSGDDTFVIGINVPLTYFDSDEVECTIRNIHQDWIKQFYSDLFIEQKYKLYIYTEFYFSYTQREYQRPSDLSLNVLKQQKALFNPHTFFFRCLGDYQPKLVDAQAKQDILLHNNIALASAKSINFRDGAVIGRFTTWLNEYVNNQNNYYGIDPGDIECLEDEDGIRHTIKEIYFNTTQEPTVLEPHDL